MTYFFRRYFEAKYSPEGNNKAFGSLYGLVNGAGGGMYRIMFIVTVIAVILGIFLAIMQFMIASHGRPMEEAKNKLQRLMWLALGTGAMTGVVAVIFKVFSWS